LKLARVTRWYPAASPLLVLGMSCRRGSGRGWGGCACPLPSGRGGSGRAVLHCREDLSAYGDIIPDLHVWRGTSVKPSLYMYCYAICSSHRGIRPLPHARPPMARRPCQGVQTTHMGSGGAGNHSAHTQGRGSLRVALLLRDGHVACQHLPRAASGVTPPTLAGTALGDPSSSDPAVLVVFLRALHHPAQGARSCLFSVAFAAAVHRSLAQVCHPSHSHITTQTFQSALFRPVPAGVLQRGIKRWHH
jgi:hypothetical protein